MNRNNLFIYFLMLSVLMISASCTNDTSTASDDNTLQIATVKTPQYRTEIQEKEVKEKTETEVEKIAEPELTQEEEEGTKTITAKFVKFSLGDASHYIFEDESGKRWDFGGCESKTFTFEEELKESAINSDNQGWGSNKELQGKWFVLSYDQKEEPLYIDGPIGIVNIIKEAKLK